MLGHLGFAATIELQETEEGPCLQISTSQSEPLIGRQGSRLDDLQYLVNRVLRRHFPDAPRVKVDCEHYREVQEDKLAGEVRKIAEKVKADGKPFKMRPLNAYYRRMVYRVLGEVEGVETVSPPGEQRLKQITIRQKNANTPQE